MLSPKEEERAVALYFTIKRQLKMEQEYLEAFEYYMKRKAENWKAL